MSRPAAALLASVVTLIASSAAAQDHSMHNMPGMTMPMPMPKATPAKKPVAKAPAAKRQAAPPRSATPRRSPAPHQAAHTMPGMDHGATDDDSTVPAGDDVAMPGMDHSGHDMSQMAPGQDMTAMAEGAKEGTDLPPGDAPAPPAPMPHYADRYWNPAEMERGRDIMMGRDGGGQTFSQIMFNLAEAQIRGGRDGYRWDGEGWFGGDINRLVVKTEGEGTFGDQVDAAEVQALYSRAIGPYFNLQGGVRHDFQPSPTRTYATVGVEGLAPYWFEVEAAAFLSTHGDLLGRLEGYYDQRLTQRLILQPRAEFNLSAQRVRAIGLGSGLTSAELGLRLRYEIKREFAPYVGVSWERRTGGTADLARERGEDTGGASLALGIRAWF